MDLTLSPGKPARVFALTEALVVTVIWASSFIFVKVGLTYMGPLTLVGLRYGLAFLLLLPLMHYAKGTGLRISPALWARLFLIGIAAYTVGNGMLYWGLVYLSATTSAFLASLLPLFVLVASILWLREVPTSVQLVGIALTLSGSGLFFADGLQAGEPLGLALTAVSLVGFTVFSALGREVARDRAVSTLALTAIPLGVGSFPLLVIGPIVEGPPKFSWPAITIVFWLAVVNSALAYWLYNHALQVLTAVEMNVTLNLSVLVTAMLSWFFLGERFILPQLVGMILIIIGVALVEARQVRV